MSCTGDSIFRGSITESPLEVIGASPIPSALAASSPISSRLELYVALIELRTVNGNNYFLYSRRSSFMNLPMSPTLANTSMARRHTIIGGSPLLSKYV